MRSEHLALWVFAASLLGMGFLGVVQGEAVAVWAPLPKGLPAGEALAYASALLSTVCGLGLLIPRLSRRSALGLCILLMAWLLFFRTPMLYRAPLSAVSWESLGEIVVVLAGVGTLYAGFAADFAGRRTALRAAQMLYGLAMLAFGAAHLAYVKETAALIPAWIPLHTAWVYLTGGTYIASGFAVLLNLIARTAAALSALQMGLFSILVWVPLVLSQPRDAGRWSELWLSCALAASGWIIACVRPTRARVPGVTQR